MTAEPHPVLPGAVRQNGYVVRDLRGAIEAWLAIGVGPWILLPSMRQEMTHRGEAVAPRITIAFANSGPLQIELIEPAGDGPSVYHEFLASGREGFHHLAWWAEDYERFEAAATAAAWPIITSGSAGGVARFCYAELDPRMSTVVEVMELNDATRGLMDLVRDAATGWDGRDPIRPAF